KHLDLVVSDLRPVLVQLVVEPLDHVGNPAQARLAHDELDAGPLLEDAREAQSRERLVERRSSPRSTIRERRSSSRSRSPSSTWTSRTREPTARLFATSA